MQPSLFPDIETIQRFPTTRYQGSKAKYVAWIWHHLKTLPFKTALDAFGGTGCVAYQLKQAGKAVDYNDILTFNSIIGRALIENDSTVLEDFEVENLIIKHDCSYPDFIERTFDDIYFTREENHWLDVVSANIRAMENPYKQAIAYFALFQACIIKRPYNLFHRKNLYIRLQDVKRSFGNKTTWDTSFEQHFRHFIEEANQAVFSNRQENRALNCNIFNIPNKYDLVYIDSPYISQNGVGVNYADFYHFLEGLTDYDNWESRIDYNSKHRRLKPVESEWTNPNKITDAFEQLIQQFQDSILAISYRSNGIPTIETIVSILEKFGKKVIIHESGQIKYVLSNSISKEVLIIGK